MQKNKNRKIVQLVLQIVTAGIVTALVFWLRPEIWAATIKLPPVPGLPSTTPAGNDTFFFFVQNQLIPVVKFILEGVAIFFVVFYGAHMTLSAGNEEGVKKDRTALSYAIYGFIFLNVGDIFIKVFDPVQNAGQPDLFQGDLLVGTLVTGLRLIAGTIAVAWLILSGFRMITAAGKEEIITQQRTQIVWTAMGLVLIAMAGSFQDVFFNAKTTEGISLFTSLTNLMLLFTVPIGFLFLVIGAFYMITARGNDAMVGKGRKILQATVVAMVIIYSAYSLLSEILKYANF